jgi:tRNA-Thr(GGU) m(6)t(6)A37 methyltransferase TsaA
MASGAPTRWFRVQPIGFVRRPGAAEPVPGEFYDPNQETIIEIFPRWADGLTGIEDFSHLVVIFWLDRMPRLRKVKPRISAELREGLPPVGFFSTRTPKRPNPIGISCPRLIRREGNNLIVTGIDAWPDTPVLDIKGYFPRDELRPDATVPEWLERLWRKHDEERGG